MKFTALTYNLHKGRHFLSRRFVLKELKEAFEKLSPDLIFLQEVMGLEGGQSHLDLLATPFGYHQAYGQNNSMTEKHYGNAILSRFPIIDSANRNISTNRFEKRGSLQARVQIKGEEMLLVCLHLDLLEAGRALQVQNVVHQIKHHLTDKSPILLAGDFNDWRGRVCSVLESSLGMENAFQSEVHQGQPGHTFPSFFPTVSLDRFYFRKLIVRDIKVLKGAPWNRLSDHCPVLATFELL
jgi:endonuclease/exonuclease/phosphatase family metal-dependent hydrolase